MNKTPIEALDTSSLPLVEASIALLVDAFDNTERYNAQRLNEELRNDAGLFYRQL